MGPAYLLPAAGAISEIFGSCSSGKTAMIHSYLADITNIGGCCSVVDTLQSFDPLSAELAGVNLSRLLWVRGDGRVDHAFKAADMLVHAGGFSAVVLDLCEADPRDLNRIPLSYWYRFRLAVENTPTRLIVMGDTPLAKSCARLQSEARRARVRWQGPVFAGLEFLSVDHKSRFENAGFAKCISLKNVLERAG
jgi:RecA/RadA recombinase